MSKLYPDAYFKSIHEINPEFFTNKGINTILCDIDNTLITYEEKYPNNEIIKLFNYFSENNLSIILLSNNSKKRVSIVISGHSWCVLLKGKSCARCIVFPSKGDSYRCKRLL